MRFGLQAIIYWSVVAFTLGACSDQGGSTVSRERKLRQRWGRYLKDGFERSNFDKIAAVDPRVGTVSGFRLWQGDYRGVPIALYSCSYSKAFGGELGWIGVVLAVEETALPLASVHPNYSGGPVARGVVREVAEHKYKADDIAISTILRDPRHENTWSIGQVRVAIKDQGDGRLGFRIGATKKPMWTTLDLEQVLSGENLSGPKQIRPLPFQELTPEQFAKAMIAILRTFRVTADPWWQSSPTSSEMAAADHPLWEDPSAVKLLLTSAPAKELVHAINFMERRSWRDSRYLRRLARINATLLGLANHESAEVRGAFGYLLRSTLLWPEDVHKLEPLLETDDPQILSQVLAAFAFRGHPPKNSKRIRELTKSKDSQVRFEAERVLRLGDHR
jgi:hypothetical protein